MSHPQPDSSSTSSTATSTPSQPEAPALVSPAPQKEPERSSADEADAAPPASRTPAAPQSRRAGRILILALVVGLVLCGGLLVTEKQQTSRLRNTVVGLTSELEEAQDALAVHEQRLEQIRVQVGDIVGRVGALQALVGVGEASSQPPAESLDAAPTLEPQPLEAVEAIEPADEVRGETPSSPTPVTQGRTSPYPVNPPAIRPYSSLGSELDDFGFGSPSVASELDAPIIY